MMKFLHNKKSNKKKGFTLLELLIAIAIFIIVISVIVSLFVSALKGQRRAIASQNVQDNARYLLSFIAKEVRMSDLQAADPYSISITRPDGESVDYIFNNSNETIERFDSVGGGPVNSENVTVTGRFNVLGLGDLDLYQPRVTIIMKVETTDPDDAEVSVQTTLSPRNLEIPSP